MAFDVIKSFVYSIYCVKDWFFYKESRYISFDSFN